MIPQIEFYQSIMDFCNTDVTINNCLKARQDSNNVYLKDIQISFDGFDKNDKNILFFRVDFRFYRTDLLKKFYDDFAVLLYANNSNGVPPIVLKTIISGKPTIVTI